MEKEINRIKESYMYENFGIIPNQIYNFQFKDGIRVDGVIINFDSKTFFIKGVVGMYMIVKNDIDSVRPSETSRNIWEESRTEYLKSFVQPI